MKNKKYLIIAVSICLIALLIYAGSVHWNNYVQKKETIASLEWVVPLSEGYSYRDDYDNKYLNIRCEKLQKKLKDLDLKLVVVENKEEEDYSDKDLYGVKNNDEINIIPAIYSSIKIGTEQKYILAGYYSPPNKESDNSDKNNSNNMMVFFPYDVSNHGTYKYHYYNIDGTDFIKEDFEDASMFENGYACVEKKGEHFVISTTGEELLKVNCDSLNIFDGARGLFEFSNDNEAVYKNGSETIHVSGPLTGLVDIYGNVILEPKYELIGHRSENEILVSYRNSKGQDQCMFLDNKFKPISGKIYDRVNRSYEGVITAKYKGRWYIINENEEVLAKIENCKEVHDFSEGIAMIECNKELKYIDTTGKVLFAVPNRDKEYVWSVCQSFSEGIVGFESRYKKFGYMDTKGNVIIAPIFDDAHQVQEGEAYVEIGEKAGVIKFPN